MKNYFYFLDQIILDDCVQNYSSYRKLKGVHRTSGFLKERSMLDNDPEDPFGQKHYGFAKTKRQRKILPWYNQKLKAQLNTEYQTEVKDPALEQEELITGT